MEGCTAAGGFRGCWEPCGWALHARLGCGVARKGEPTALLGWRMRGPGGGGSLSPPTPAAAAERLPTHPPPPSFSLQTRRTGETSQQFAERVQRMIAGAGHRCCCLCCSVACPGAAQRVVAGAGRVDWRCSMCWRCVPWLRLTHIPAAAAPAASAGRAEHNAGPARCLARSCALRTPSRECPPPPPAAPR